MEVEDGEDLENEACIRRKRFIQLKEAADKVFTIIYYLVLVAKHFWLFFREKVN